MTQATPTTHAKSDNNGKAPEAPAAAPKSTATAVDKRKLWADYFATNEAIEAKEAEVEVLKASRSAVVKAIVDASDGKTAFSVEGRGVLKYRKRAQKDAPDVVTHYFATDSTVAEKVKL